MVLWLKLKDNHVLILELIEEGQPQTKIAKKLKIKRQTLFGIIGTLKKHGYVRRLGKSQMAITPLARQVLDNLTSKPYVRLHYFKLKYELKDRLKPDEPVRLIEMAGIGVTKINGIINHEDAIFLYGSIKFKLTPSSLIAYVL